MNKKLKPFVAVIVIPLLFACNKSSNPTADKFLRYVNNYQADSLNTLLTDDFTYRRAYISKSGDKEYFMNKYLPNAKEVGGKWKVIEMTGGNVYLLESEGGYLSYLKVKACTWKMTIDTKGEKVKSVFIDTTADYREYINDVVPKSGAFAKWLKGKYNETPEELLNRQGATLQRVKEFSEI